MKSYPYIYNSLKLGACVTLIIILTTLSLTLGQTGFPAPTPKSKIIFEPVNPVTQPGAAVLITAKIYDANGNEVAAKDLTTQNLTWQLVDNSMNPYVHLEPKDNGQLVVFGLAHDPTTDTDAISPTSIPILATYNGATPAIKNVITVSLEPAIPKEVDVMWTVLPKQICRDNFGKRVHDQYYCIAVTIGNNSGYDLQIASVGFTVPARNPEAAFTQTQNGATGQPLRQPVPLPNMPYRMVRGTVLREQQVGLRNTLSNTISALGLLATGFSPFFKVPNHASNFKGLVNIFSNPFAQGFNTVVPDTTIKHLERLDDQGFRNDINTRTIVNSNSEIVTIVFFPKEILFPKSNQDKGKDDPLIVMQKLGDLVLVGQQVSYINRIRLSSQPLAVEPESTPTPTPSPSPATSPTQGSSSTLPSSTPKP